jgi:dTMP kinase
MDNDGRLLVLEGSDGSGKTTQFNLLSERLKAAGYEVAVFDFPRYDKDSSHFIKQYLNGRYGPASSVSPYTASLFYALDRYEAAKDIRKALGEGKIVLSNRYVGSNMAHQGSKFDDPVEQRGFFVWEDNLEFQLLDIPRPDANLFLRVPAEISQKLIGHKAARDYTSKSHDEHEADISHLKKSVATFDLLCQLFPKDFQAIECTKNNEMLSVPQISNLIWDKLQPLLPKDKPHRGHSAVVTLNNSPESSRPPSANGSADKLVHEFKNASLNLKFQIEKHVKSIEPAGFSVWSDNNYKFYTPQGLPREISAAYKAGLERIAGLHKRMRTQLESYYEKTLLSRAQGGAPLPNITSLLLPATPVAAITDFSAMLSAKAVNRVCRDLLADDSEELQWAAKQLYTAARQLWPEDFKPPLESDSPPEPLNDIIAKLAVERLNLNSADAHPVKLLEALPRQEFDLLAETIYPFSNLSLDEISEEVADWSYAQKYDSLKQAAADPALLLEKIRYKFDIISDQVVLSEIADSVLAGSLQMQTASPRNGYDVPETIEEAGIDELFLDCFDESLKLFSLLQQTGRDDLGVYATLLGHKIRWQLSANAQDMKNILEHKGSPAYARLVSQIREAVTEVHPLTWEVLTGASGNSNQPRPKNRVKPSKRRPAKRGRRQDK